MFHNKSSVKTALNVKQDKGSVEYQMYWFQPANQGDALY